MTNPASTVAASDGAGLLGDTPSRDYSRKLQLFNAFAEPELRRLIGSLSLGPGMRILDVGCGTGEALHWFLEAAESAGEVVGIDLAAAHVNTARRRTAPQIRVLQGDLMNAPLPSSSFDFIWCVNTINHLHDPVAGVKKLADRRAHV